jgi:hypothetical protein
MLYAEVFCRECDRLRTDLDAVLDAGHRSEFDGECHKCGSTALELRVRYGEEREVSYKTGPAYEVDHPKEP